MAIAETSKHQGHGPRDSENNASHLHRTTLQTQVKPPRETYYLPSLRKQMEEEYLCME